MRSLPIPAGLTQDFRKMAGYLDGQRRRFDETRRLLVEHAAWLEPGDWVRVPVKRGVWHHTCATLPHAVVVDVVKEPKSAASGASPRRRVKTGILAGARLVQGLRQPSRVEVPPVEPSRGNATIVINANDPRGDLTVLEPEAGRALRLAKPGSYDREYVEVRHRFQRHLPAPGFSVSDDGAVLLEDFIDGQLLKGLPAERQVAVAVEVLHRYADLVAAERASDEGTVWEALPRLLDQVRVPEVLWGLLADPRVWRLLTSGLLAPGKGDQAAGNILVQDASMVFHVIDFDQVAWLPVWWDPVGLVGRLPGHAGRLTGDQHRALASAADRVWASAGLEGTKQLTPQHWAALEALRMAWRKSARTNYPKAAGGLVEPDPNDFAGHLHQQAGKVEAQLARP